jgi:hypothetical protein
MIYRWREEAEEAREQDRLFSLTQPLVECWYCHAQRHQGGDCECGAPPEMPENFL